MKALISVEQMRAHEKRLVDELHISYSTLMEVAGRGVAECVAQACSKDEHILILGGAGNNGGDAWIAGRVLAAQGFRLSALLVGKRESQSEDAKAALLGFEALCGPVPQLKEASGEDVFLRQQLLQADLVIDGLVGIGLKGAVREGMGQLITLLNQAQKRVFSIDVPSGLQADTGELHGPCVRAEECITFAYPKTGHSIFPGAEYCGKVTTLALGPAPSHWVVSRKQALGPGDLSRFLQGRARNSHKGSFGRLGVWAGAERSPGAAVLCLKAALNTGIGLLSWLTDEALAKNEQRLPPEVMTPRWPSDELFQSIDAAVVGPGWQEDEAQHRSLVQLLNSELPLCIDATALRMLPRHAALLKSRKAPTVLTPHPGEAAQLAGLSSQEVQAQRLKVGQSLAEAFDCVVVLKGAGTLICDPSGRCSVISAGNPGMAVGGSGDVLAGMVGCRLAQKQGAFEAAAGAALMHALAGDRVAEEVGETALTPSLLLDALRTLS